MCVCLLVGWGEGGCVCVSLSGVGGKGDVCVSLSGVGGRGMCVCVS